MNQMFEIGGVYKFPQFSTALYLDHIALTAEKFIPKDTPFTVVDVEIARSTNNSNECRTKILYEDRVWYAEWYEQSIIHAFKAKQVVKVC